MSLPSIVAALKERAGQLVMPPTYDAIRAYLQGFDRAHEGGLLVGFREWLVVELGGGNNLAWPALVDACRDRTALPLSDESALSYLFQLLERFFEERSRRDGLRRIFVSYERWLTGQPWYDPTSPHWISPDGRDREKK